jgi:hypothetical protein
VSWRLRTNRRSRGQIGDRTTKYRHGRRDVGAVPPWPKALGVALVIAVASLGATPAFAAPEWGIEMTHANAYGLQASECPGGKEVYVPGEPEKDCGVDPFTGSGTTFSRESGFDTYTITVKNTASATLKVGDTLSCHAGFWVRDESNFDYRWLRSGVLISGAEASEYTLTAADEGTSIQCEVVGLNGSYATSATTTALSTAPVSTTAAPALSTEVNVSEESATVAVGSEQSCTPGAWSGNPAFGFQWLRNGAPIPSATSSTYIVGVADAGTAVQCEVTATNAGGNVAAINVYPLVVAPEPGEESERPAHPENNPAEGRPGPTLPNSAEVVGPVSVADRLPEGLVLAGKETEVSGVGWRCAVATAAAAFTCSRTNPEEHLGPGQAYAPIVAHTFVAATAPDVVTNVSTVNGGGAATQSTYDSADIAPAVPLGIASLETSVTDGLGSPFTQAGGHPFAANATFVLNYTVSDAGDLQVAGGTPKDVESDLPPGFVGNPTNAGQCTASEYQTNTCPDDSRIGFVDAQVVDYEAGNEASIEHGRANPFANSKALTEFVYNLVPSPGVVAAFGFVVHNGPSFVLSARVRSDGGYGVTIGDQASGRFVGGPGLQAASVTFCSYGVTGQIGLADEVLNPSCQAAGSARPLLTNPTQCTDAAPITSVRADTYQEPFDYAAKSVYTGTNLVNGAPSAIESFVTGCNLLHFNPEVALKPSTSGEGGTTRADEPTGASFNLKVPQTNEAGVNATPELKNATVTLPEGMTVDPSAADGLQACSNAKFGLGSTSEPAEPASCPLASQIGTVKVTTPLLEKPLEGQVFLGEPECSPCSNTDAEDGHIFRLFLQVHSVERGVIVKLAGHVSANPTTGRLQATFTDQPQLPFSELLLTFNGGARASLANPQTCGTFTTTTDLMPWSTSGVGGLSGSEAIAGTPDATPSSSFNVDWNGAGGACPATMPFSPSFSAGSQTPAAGASSPFAVTVGREDREQDIAAVTVTTPPGLLGEVSQVPRCPEAQANAGTCDPESQVGTTTVGAGPGPHPFYLGGRVYLTGPYKGQPFGLSIVTPAVAGPFNLGTVVVRASIAVNPSTGALTVVSDPLPQYVDGVQLRLRRINVEVNRPGFMLNPTSCAQQAVGATITAAQGASSTISTPFEVGGCASLPFSPSFSASTQAKTSKANGASLTITVKSAPGQANIGKVDVQLPKALPARLIPTLQNACTEAQFNTNPAGCPADSFVGTATAVTPILNAPLSGPAILVSHGGAAFPDLEFLLQGENGVEIVLDGKTDIKGGITYSKFESVPDAPISSFVTTLPEGPHSILAAPSGNLCGKSLVMPTTITAQNGKQIIQKTKITVTGCAAVKTKPLTRAQKLKRALHACRTKYKTKSKKAKRLACETQARKRYGPIKKAKKTNRRGK